MDFITPYSLCFLLLFLLFTFFTGAQFYENISLGSFLTAGEDNSFWASHSGEFAFGFKQIQNGDFILAIWFNQIPEKTIVWSANRNKLVQRGSTVRLTEQGWLVLIDQTGRQIWSAYGGTEVAYAAMLNTGNFILANNKSANLWESFHHPTDTLLPTQTFNQGSKLIACYSEANHSTGRFLLTLESDGNLVLYTTAFPVDSPNYAYWSTETFDGSSQVIFNQSGYVYLVEKNGSMINVLPGGASTEDFFQRAILEYDGAFRHYVYPKNNGSTSGRWPLTWSPLSFIPSNICTSITGQVGCGACGFNSYCTIGNDQRRKCQCPQGYSFFDPNDVMKGCKQDFVPQSCDNASLEAELFEFLEMQNTDWPLSDYEHFELVSEDWCREACLSDCFCVVAIFRDTNCWKKKLPLSNGRMDTSVGGKALIKIRKDSSNLQPADPDEEKKHHSTLFIIGSVLFSSSVSLNFLLLIAAVMSAFHFYNRKNNTFQQYPVMPGINLRCFTYNELQKATNGFKEELGKGAFSTVYKGVLALDDKIFIAVKKLNNMVSENDKEFKTEVTAIGQTNHRNLVQLLGFCSEGQHRHLVYEFMSNGSLRDFLFRGSTPNWYLRIQIALGTARGLSYLHEECSIQIIHCDIKPQNVLLDDALTARICDFGLAKLLKAEQTQTSTAIRGTRGYVAPEWFKNLPITAKVDVYSFGILFLELICCRKNFAPEVKDENQMVLADWAYDSYKEENVHVLVQDDQDAIYDIRRLKKYVMIAIWCIQEDPALRPTMKKVVQMIEGAVEVPVPPDPCSSQYTSSSIDMSRFH
ncbi:PREDICTED: G-type lectin S-receptor-like serine/threonine-protein kinase LECRK3 [Theobroma cacao]|uniref:Receptor-like serine/threonine-protein kinase n=1 Tax=Theobroma cacao TaxID=3641 RepID=A0AB32WXE2_THECC|nr:PREDICTED: G-type lectin S-receptor-like serine/threonine-protein kinase LECRK3 [Theobroma cacao]